VGLKNISIFLCIFLITGQTVIVSAQGNSSLKELQGEIKIYNLINGLYLDKNQMEFILSCAQELKQKKDEWRYVYENNLANQREVLLSLKNEVRNNKTEVSPDLARDVHRTKLEIQKLRKEYIDTSKSKAQAVKSILSKNQLYTIENYKPCLVPAQGSARIGEDNSGKQATELLERIRTMPKQRYNQKKHIISQKHVERLSMKLPMLKPEELKQAQNSLLKIMDKAKALSDTDFLIEKNNLAKQIKDITSPPEKAEAEEKIARFLLDASIISVLQDKLK